LGAQSGRHHWHDSSAYTSFAMAVSSGGQRRSRIVPYVSTKWRPFDTHWGRTMIMPCSAAHSMLQWQPAGCAGACRAGAYGSCAQLPTWDLGCLFPRMPRRPWSLAPVAPGRHWENLQWWVVGGACRMEHCCELPVSVQASVAPKQKACSSPQESPPPLKRWLFWFPIVKDKLSRQQKDSHKMRWLSDTKEHFWFKLALSPQKISVF